MSSTFDVAVAGARGLVGTEILKLLLQRKFPTGKVHALGSGEAVGEFVEFGDDELQVQDLANFDFSGVQVALFTLDADSASLYVPRATEAGGVVIDNSLFFRDEADVPLVVPAVNVQAIDGYPRRRILASPSASVVQMLLALKPIYDAVGIVRVSVATYQPVSGNGQLAIDELVRQSIQALNGQGVDDFRIYPRPIAFNALPQSDAFSADGDTLEEKALSSETRKILDDGSISISATAVRVPVFHGSSQALHIETCDKITARQACVLLRQAPGVRLLDGDHGNAYPTAVTDAAQEDAVFVGRVREDASNPLGLKLWTVADDIRTTTALNGVQIAEILIRDHL